MSREIDEQFVRLYGLPCWGVHWDADTGLRLEFGEPHLVVREPAPGPPGSGRFPSLTYRHVYAHGDWRLWVEGHWKLTLRDIAPVRSSSSFRKIQMGLARLDGQKLQSATVDVSTGFTRLMFDLGAVLEIRRLGRGDDGAFWMLHTPDDLTLMVRGDGCYCLGSSYDEDELDAWRPVGGPNNGIQTDSASRCR